MGSTERDQLAQVAELARQHHIIWHHCADTRRCEGASGLSDLILVGRGGVMFRELKDDPRHETPAQVTWRYSLRAAGADVGIWLPSSFRRGEVEEAMRTLGSPAA